MRYRYSAIVRAGRGFPGVRPSDHTKEAPAEVARGLVLFSRMTECVIGRYGKDSRASIGWGACWRGCSRTRSMCQSGKT